MKRFILNIGMIPCIFLLVVNLSAQCVGENFDDPCCNELIQIDPMDNAIRTTNNERINLPNNQDIDFSSFDIYWMTNLPFTVFDNNHGNYQVNNPFFMTNSYYTLYTNYHPLLNPSVDENPMHPRYGWQLMHAYNGFKPFTSMTSMVSMGSLNQGLEGYHYLFYNKYTGQARALIYPSTNQDFQPGRVSVALGFDKNNRNQNNKVITSGLLNEYRNRILALDQECETIESRGLISPLVTVDESNPAIADFNLSYDPCVCINTPILELTLQNNTSSKLYSEGKYAGISRQFDNSGNIPSNYGKDWLSSVYGDYDDNDNFEVKGGFQIYGTADSLAKSYYVSPTMKFVASAIGLMSKAIPKLNVALLGTYTASQLWGSIKDNTTKATLSQVYQDAKKSKLGLDIPIGSVLAGGADYLKGIINPEVPNVFFSEGQIAMRGVIETEKLWGGFTRRYIDHPGSEGTKSSPLGRYPYYNEAPGVFALLNTPKTLLELRRQTGAGGMISPSNTTNKLNFTIAIDEKLNYAINPASEVKESESYANAMIEFDYYMPRCMERNLYTIEGRVYKGFNCGIDNDSVIKKLFPKEKGFLVVNHFLEPRNVVEKKLGNYFFEGLFKSDETNRDDFIDRFVIQTYPMSIDKIHRYEFNTVLAIDPVPSCRNCTSIQNALELHNSNFFFRKLPAYLSAKEKPYYDSFFDFRIKFENHYKFQDNYYGTPPELENVYPYLTSVELNRKDKLDFEYVPEIIYTSDLTPQQIASKVIRARTIVVDNPINDLDLYFVNKVQILNGGRVNATVRTFKVDDLYFMLGLNPISSKSLKIFCNENKYKSNQSKQIYKIAKESSKFEENITNITLYPNPANLYTEVEFRNLKDKFVTIELYDMLGKLLLKDKIKSLNSDKETYKIVTENLKQGIYIVKLIFDDFSESKKLTIEK